MKQTYFSLFLLVALGLCSCRKGDINVDIKTYDQQQIEAYIKTNNLTNMKRDVSNGDTTGIYYEILSKGTSAINLDYPDRVSMVYTLKSFDGLYGTSDTIANHAYNYVGNMAPNGLMLSILNIVKNKGTRARLLIPSRLAYGRNGSGAGSTRLRGNQCLDYYVNLLDETGMVAYDELSIKKYMQSAGIDVSTYSRTASGTFYKITQAGTGTVYPSATGTVGVQSTGSLLNGTIFDTSGNGDDAGTSFTIDGVLKGYGEALQKGTAGAKISMYIPSNIAYGVVGRTDGGIPSSSVLHFEINLISVTN